MEDLVLIFENSKCTDNKLTGGKGASLAKMYQYGIPIPQGFVVTTRAFEKFLSTNELEKVISSSLEKVTVSNLDGINKASERIQAAITKGSIADKLKNEILTQYDTLNLNLVAVRSSATSEDSDTDSWAGELETYLNTTKEDLIDNIKKCWASLYSPRAITYALERKIKPKDGAVAVVVQEMVQSDISGICFTVHPISMQKNIMLIEAVYGLGEGIVSGQLTPDSYEYNKEYDVVLRVDIAEQDRKLALPKDLKGLEWEEIEEEYSQKLDYRRIQELARICTTVESFYDKPQDIEWAYRDNTFYITQSRPITTIE
ncbi:hypothetical protein GF360_03455 [candidate division WWE3 bacterium]|nr:hypothetical protein [candidate division WWE3 bacterium]